MTISPGVGVTFGEGITQVVGVGGGSLSAKARALTPGVLVEDFENVSDWADFGGTGGTLSADTVNFKTGTQSLNWDSVDTTIRKRYKYFAGGVNWDDGDFFDLWAYFPTVTSTPPQLQMFAATAVDAAADFSGAGLQVLGAAFTGTPRPGVQHWRFKKSDFSGSLDWTHVYNIMFVLNPIGGAQNVSLDALYLQRRLEPNVIFTLDDGSANQHTAYIDFFKPKGIKVSMFVNGSTIDTGGTTTAELLAMTSNGDEVANHTFNHTDLTTLGNQAAMEAEIQLQSDWMIARGLTQWNLLAYPNGNFNDTVIAACQAVGITLARSLRNADGQLTAWDLENNTLGVANEYALNAINLANTLTLTQAKAAVDKVIDYGGTLIFYGHLFDTVASGDTWANSDLNDLLDYVNLKKSQDLIGNILIGSISTDFKEG